MMFPDDVALVVLSINMLEGELESWREIFEKNGLKIGKAKRELLKLWFKNKVREIKVVVM